MKNYSKITLLSLGAIAVTGLLFSFQSDNEDEKKKKYQIIHSESGTISEYDTLVPMNSTYTVEQFLADKNINNENVEIINVPNMSEHMMVHGEGSFGMDKIFIHDAIEEMDGEENMIIKIINDEEMEFSDSDLEKLENLEETLNVKMIELIGSDFSGSDGTMVKIISETDHEGNQVTKKFVNGEEVELTEEDMENLKNHEFKHEDGHHMSKTIKIDGDTEIDIKEILKEIEIELENINIHEINDEEGHHMIKMIKIDGEEGEINMEELLKEIEIDVDKDGHNVFIKTIDINGLENDINWNSEDVHIDSGDQEDFTIVLITEDVDENHSKSNVMRSEKKGIEGLKIYPNPTSEMITIEFSQEEKIKTSISIMDLNGKVVFKENLGKFTGTYTKNVDLKPFGTGTYLINIKKGKDVTSHKVVVK